LLAQPVRHHRLHWLFALLLVIAAIVLTTPRYDAQLMPEATARRLFGAVSLLPPIDGARVSRTFSGTSPTVACRLPNLRELNHPALDFAPRATPMVRAALAGEVIEVADSGSPWIRKIVHVRHASGLVATYAHVEQALVPRGDRVAAGQTIARMPTTGNGYLHFELHYHNQIVNPNFFLP
jgi:murein DD-endopeptidase MepM/ murein hydrolase activator NlpD